MFTMVVIASVVAVVIKFPARQLNVRLKDTLGFWKAGFDIPLTCWACTMYHDATDASGSQEDLAALRSNVPLMFAFTIPVISLMIMMASASHQLLSTA